MKCSSNYSEEFQRVDLGDADVLRRLRSAVRLGVWFHFAKFYIILMPFYCGVQAGTIPLSIVGGVFFGFVLMWAVFGELNLSSRCRRERWRFFITLDHLTPVL